MYTETFALFTNGDGNPSGSELEFWEVSEAKRRYLRALWHRSLQRDT